MHSKKTFRSIVLCFIAAGLIAPAAFAPAKAQQGAQTEAATEFRSIVAEIQGNASRLGATELRALSEKLLFPFIEKYPGAKETSQARIALGQIYSTLGDNAEAIKQFKIVAEESGGSSSKERTTVLYLLGMAYIQEEEFDNAETVFTKMKKEAAGDEEAVNAATNAIEMIDTQRKLTKGSLAIPFPDSTRTTSGEKISLEDYRGKVVLLDFWATWCAPCRQEMPNVLEVYRKYNGKGFEIIGVSMDRDRESLDSYIEENGIAWKQIYDGKNWQSDLGKVYAVRSIPSTFLIGKEGKIREKNLRGEELEKAVKKLIEED